MDGERNEGNGLLGGGAIKLLACLFMLVDHIGMILLPEVTALRIIGRLAMPLFAFTFAEGCRHTRHKAKRFVIVFAIGIVTGTGMSTAYGEPHFDIMTTLSLSSLVIYSLDGLKNGVAERNARAAALMSAALAASLGGSIWLCCFSGVHIDYGIAGVLLPVTVRLFDPPVLNNAPAPAYRPHVSLPAFAAGLVELSVALGGIQFFCLASLPVLAFYGGSVGRVRMKYFFYVFYPAHLALLAAVYIALRPELLQTLF